MSRVLDAITWSGVPVVSLFVVSATDEPTIDFTGWPASDVRVYRLEDEAGVLAGRSTYAYDVSLESVPSQLDELLVGTLRQACAADHRVAWFAFEGSFDFGHLLTDDVADQVFGVCVGGREPEVALTDAVLGSEGWKAKTRLARSRLFDE